MITIQSAPFGTTADGRAVTRYTLSNSGGMRVSVISYGCTVQSILIPDQKGLLRDVVLGYDSIGDYEKGSSYFGAFVGRYANRITNAAFTLNGIRYQLEKNEGENHLHGVFSRKVYDAAVKDDAVVFSYVSPPSEEGYPGVLTGTVAYRLTEDNALIIEYRAASDEDTVINLTNHTYFNLNGQDGSDILSHRIRINADRFTDITASRLSGGHILSVEGTPFDFRAEKTIGADIFGDHIQLRYASGYDQNMIVNGTPGTLREAACAFSDDSGIRMTAYTTEPGMQFYTGNFIHEDAAERCKCGVRYPRFGGFCLEAQRYPDSMNQPLFPVSVLRKGEVYHQKTIYQFSIG